MKREKNKLLKIYSITILFIIILVLLFTGVIKYFFIYNETKEKYKFIDLKIKKEEIKKEEIQESKERLKSNSEIERKILKKNMLKRPGEKIIELID